jgi:hypothetical protein
LAELEDLVISTVQTDEADPHVFEAVHMLSGDASSHIYLLFFCACAVVQFRERTIHKKNSVVPPLSFL